MNHPAASGPGPNYENTNAMGNSDESESQNKGTSDDVDRADNADNGDSNAVNSSAMTSGNDNKAFDGDYANTRTQ